MSVRTFLATLSGWSLASLSKVARKFLHLILAVSGVICCPIPPAPAAGEATLVVTGLGAGLLLATGLGLLMATGCVGSLTGGPAGLAAATCVPAVAGPAAPPAGGPTLNIWY